MSKLIVSLIVGAVLGGIGSKVLFVGSALSLIPWTIVGLLLGYWSEKRGMIVNGAAYGFALAFIFMVAGYTGSASLISRLPFFALLGLFGAVCGAVLGWLGNLAKKLVMKK